MNVHLVDFLELFNRDIQYSVPQWQRRYSWNKSTVEQLVKDLTTVAQVDDEHVRHFGGTVITYSESTPPGMANIYHVVDGQQRLTTISILLICIAMELKEKGSTPQWDSHKIREAYLENRMQPTTKLCLQDKDHEEYESILYGYPRGDGKITQSWMVLRKAVASAGPDNLMRGLSRLRVISFTCKPSDDPQQIFESLNATGVPLTEGEKVKNWLLMGLDRETQGELYQTYWIKIENCLKGEKSDQIDEFLRDFLRWKTGENWGRNKIYENLRRWWLKIGSKDRTDLCKEFARLAELYGKITGTNGQHQNAEVSDLLQHLRSIGFDVHRPFTLRLLDDATRPETTGASEKNVIKVLESLSIWLTRLWLADKTTSGLNTQFASFAYDKHTQRGPYADYWIGKIKKLRYSRIAVPNEKEIAEGIAKRKAYGGKATNVAKTILWTMNNKLGNYAPLRIEDLSVEHIMPRTLSEEWRGYLGKDVAELKEKYGNSLVNLTLVGKRFNPEISNQIYSQKRKLYKESSFRLTRDLAQKYENWRAEDMDARGQELTELALECWPWENVTRAKIRWRISGGDWREEKKYSKMLLNVVAELLDFDPERKSELLLGNYIRMGSKRHSTRFRQVPGHEEYVANIDYTGDAICKRCTKMAERCGETIEFEYRNKQQSRWESRNIDPIYARNPRWRINGGIWNMEESNAIMLLNVVGSLLDSNPKGNSERLLGDRMSRDIFLSGEEPEGSGRFVPIPRHSQYVINLNHNRSNILKLCREMGDRCGVRVEAE